MSDLDYAALNRTIHSNTHQRFIQTLIGTNDSPFLQSILAVYASAGLPTPDNVQLADIMGRCQGFQQAYAVSPDKVWGSFEALSAQLSPADTPPPVEGRLQGHVRVASESYTRPYWRDARGPCHVQLCSFFPALRIFRDDRPRFDRNMDLIQEHFDGARIFTAVGGTTSWGTDGQGWRGREVVPSTLVNDRQQTIHAWNDYDEIFRGVLSQFRQRRLKVFLTAGDLQYFFPAGDGEKSFVHRIARLSKPFGHIVLAFETANERWQNAYHGSDVRRARQMLLEFRAENAAPSRLLSAPSTGEEPEGLREWSQAPATICTVHGRRQSWVDAIRRVFNLSYEFAVGSAFPMGLIQGEPTGPGPDVYQPTTNKHELFGIYMMHLLCGQASVYLNSAGIRCKENLGTGWGFKQLKALGRNIPSDVGTFHLIPGHLDAAPLRADSYEDQGAGPHRVDSAVSQDGRFVSMVYGGQGAWKIRARQPMSYRLVSADGLEEEQRVQAQEYLPELRNASQKARLIVGQYL